MTTLEETGELSAIELISRYLIKRQDIIENSNDDCAIVRPHDNSAYDWLLTSDPVIEGIHFDPKTSPCAIGHKAIGRVLSDLAAMGGEPRWALVNIAAPGSTTTSILENIYDGMTRLANRYNLAVIGGDMTSGPLLQINAFAVGQVPTGKAVRRCNALQNDLIYATGSLGGSINGKHLMFEPRVMEGQYLRDWATTLIDLSDGLAADIRHITNTSGTGALLNIESIPVSIAAMEMNDGIDPIEHALCDGEDFELMFTIPDDKKACFEKSWRNTFELPCTQIGVITSQKGIIKCKDKSNHVFPLEKTGYQHFVRQK